jgi:hypothetical protein
MTDRLYVHGVLPTVKRIRKLKRRPRLVNRLYIR